MNESKKVVTTLDAGAATPIAISKNDAYDIANKQTEINNTITGIQEEKNPQENIIESKKIEEIDYQKFNQVNDFIKIEQKRTPVLTYIIMILVLITLIVIFVVFELPILRGL